LREDDRRRETNYDQASTQANRSAIHLKKTNPRRNMNKSIAYLVGLCISSYIFLIVSMAVTEGRPVARAAMGGIGILGYFLAIHFAPKSDYKKETTLQKFVFGMEIIILILTFLNLIVMIGMVQDSLIESGYVSSDAFNCVECGP
jgi:hypothetical protein